jgi:hypothetical protein
MALSIQPLGGDLGAEVISFGPKRDLNAAAIFDQRRTPVLSVWYA